ncbi:Transcriptional regulator with HTH domain and aminotransferase domain (plasmid) [Neorhizobium galegae bv. officinalis bv. officinalis str. HAMBI 1141]|uniref:Transcriptional regulator with HTH domain and aminotransferase domain n=1 Tax=Neorhizobium galegae bv. officinalis bv. officinalis str. HAMBI 1141 TaxID=1028801 RepID=A0A068TGF2_NEOGA|nr:PLP-dependent aminotransferase family protein [Neorhizobium galegae]CDN57156.1 Transcriptional regulator with HTH domain and aminotransferase domain [Neorhizobium galegae bv. officinalis bv. officinalis str. HAMBI 1141]
MVQYGEGSRRTGATRRIYHSLLNQIEAGVYGVGDALPSSRSLAEELGVSRTTVTAAFDQLVSEGYVRVQQGRKACVASAGRVSQIAPPDCSAIPARRLSAYATRAMALPPNSTAGRPPLKFDFRYGDIAAEDFPKAPWRKALNTAFLRHRDRLGYDDPAGSRSLREALQGYVWRSRGISCDLGQIIVVNGSQQALDLCARVLVNPGDGVVVEDPCYAMARNVMHAVGANIVAVPCGAHGIDTTRLPEVSDIAVAYVTPSHQFPLGGVLPAAHRQALMEWSMAANAYVIEDDYDSEYRYDVSPIPPLYLSGQGRVIYVGTVSKTLSPTLRLGYIILPHPLVEAFIECKRIADRHTSTFEQEALAALIETGAYERHVRRMRRLNAERRAVFLASMASAFVDHIEIVGTTAGLHVVVWFNTISCRQEARFADIARSHDIGIYPIARLFSSPSDERAGYIFGYASMSVDQLAKGVERLHRAYLGFIGEGGPPGGQGSDNGKISTVV